ncbi:MAG: hypothetical protein EBR02_03190 [Alphaproteobacteria bacterium]|nr:hypothetical protein [Alphaproteobacteria bacterium]
MKNKPPHKRKNKSPRPGSRDPYGMPEIGALIVTALTDQGELIAEPVKWDARKQPPRIIVTESGRQQAAAVGDAAKISAIFR